MYILHTFTYANPPFWANCFTYAFFFTYAYVKRVSTVNWRVLVEYVKSSMFYIRSPTAAEAQQKDRRFTYAYVKKGGVDL